MGATNWRNILDSHPGQYQDGISRIYFTKLNEVTHEITGTISMNPMDETQLVINWDIDTFPSNTIIQGPVRNNNQWTTIDYIIDLQKTVPTSVMKGLGGRILLLNDIGDSNNNDGPDAWKGTANEDLVAKRNDIVEWDGIRWVVVFEAATSKDVTYVTNQIIACNIWDGEEWLPSVEGLYPGGIRRIAPTANYFYEQDNLQWNSFTQLQILNVFLFYIVLKARLKIMGISWWYEKVKKHLGKY